MTPVSKFDTPTLNGFHMTFLNRYCVSVQWRPGNYCHNRTLDDEFGHGAKTRLPSPDAEVSVWDSVTGRTLPLGSHNDTVGWLSPDAVAAILSAVATGDIERAKTIARL